jgi:hypothetical protein
LGKMRNDLVAVKVKVNPLVRTAALGAAKKSSVKMARLLKVVNGKGQMKRVHSGGSLHE